MDLTDAVHVLRQLNEALTVIVGVDPGHPDIGRLADTAQSAVDEILAIVDDED